MNIIGGESRMRFIWLKLELERGLVWTVM